MTDLDAFPRWCQESARQMRGAAPAQIPNAKDLGRAWRLRHDEMI